MYFYFFNKFYLKSVYNSITLLSIYHTILTFHFKMLVIFSFNTEFTIVACKTSMFGS